MTRLHKSRLQISSRLPSGLLIHLFWAVLALLRFVYRWILQAFVKRRKKTKTNAITEKIYKSPSSFVLIVTLC